jgi:hypothetical protein
MLENPQKLVSDGLDSCRILRIRSAYEHLVLDAVLTAVEEPVKKTEIQVQKIHKRQEGELLWPYEYLTQFRSLFSLSSQRTVNPRSFRGFQKRRTRSISKLPKMVCYLIQAVGFLKSRNLQTGYDPSNLDRFGCVESVRISILFIRSIC